MSDNTAQDPRIPEESTVPQVPSNARQEGEQDEILGRPAAIAKLVGTILTAIAGTAAIFYVLGFVIVNLHLSAFGVREFSLSNASYLSAGIVFGIYHGIVLILAFGMGLQFNSSSLRFQKETVTGLILWVLSILLVTIVQISLLSWLTVFEGESASQLLSVTWTHVLMVLSFSMLTIIIVADVFKSDNEKKVKLWTAEGGVVFIVVFPLVASIVFLTSWARVVYPSIKSAFGGGAPIVVQIIPAESETLDILSNMGIEVQNGATIPVHLLEDTEKFLFVLLENENAAKLDRELNLNILYLSPDNITPSPTPIDTPTATLTSTDSPVIFVTITPTPP